MISPPRASATAIETSVFPDVVGPVIARKSLTARKRSLPGLSHRPNFLSSSLLLRRTMVGRP